MPCAKLAKKISQSEFGNSNSSLWVSARSAMLALLVLISAAAHGQTNRPLRPNGRYVVHRLPIPTNCTSNAWGEQFDFIEETLTQDWAGFRTELNDLGSRRPRPIQPNSWAIRAAANRGDSLTAEHCKPRYSGISTNSCEFPGLSFNIGAAWSTGKNLSADYIGKQLSGSERLHRSGQWHKQPHSRRALFAAAIV